MNNTYAKLSRSLDTPTSNNQPIELQTNSPQQPRRGAPSNFPTESSNFNSFSNYDDSYQNSSYPSGLYADANTDELSLLEYRLQMIQMDYVKKLKYWKARKEALLATYSLEDTVKTPANRTIKEIFKSIFDEVRALFVFPDVQLHHIYERNRPNILALETILNQAPEKLSKLPENAGAESLEKAKVCLEICNTSISLINGLGSLVNDVSREIKMCLKFEEITEKTAVTLLTFVTGLISRFPIPNFDFNFGLKDLYRKYLYHNIHKETNYIDSFMTGVEGSVGRANKAMKERMSIKQETKKEEQTVTSDKPSPTSNNTPNNSPLGRTVFFNNKPNPVLPGSKLQTEIIPAQRLCT